MRSGLTFLVLIPAVASAQSFDRIKDLTGVNFLNVNALSRDGSAIVGNDFGNYGWRLRNGVLESLKGTGGAPISGSQALAVSADGSVVVGSVLTGDVHLRDKAASWNGAGTRTNLPNLSGTGPAELRRTSAEAVSGDGTAIAGNADPVGEVGFHSYSAVAAVFGPDPHYLLDPSVPSGVVAISDDGLTVAGFRRVGSSGNRPLWDGPGAGDLSDLPNGGERVILTDMSADGETVLGYVGLTNVGIYKRKGFGTVVVSSPTGDFLQFTSVTSNGSVAGATSGRTTRRRGGDSSIPRASACSTRRLWSSSTAWRRNWAAGRSRTSKT